METVPSGSAGLGAYADSIDSLSPRSRGGESWDEAFVPSAAVAAAAAAAAQAEANASKLRLMCSYGGQIVPRPHDRSLCYLGGETRIVVVDRHSTLADLHSRVSRSVLGGRPFSLKYQLPSEDLDSLISVTTDEDLDNMIEEYDRIVASASSSAPAPAPAAGAKPPRLRLFLFPAKPDSAGPSPIGSLLDDSKSETWFVDALNNTMLGRVHSSADSASSVNCLLGLDDSKASPNGAGTGDGGGIPPGSENEMALPRRDSSGKLGGGSRHGGQDMPSGPDSQMLEAASSFGSASSAPPLSNLPPIRVHPDDRGPNLRAAIGAGLEEHFAQMNVSDQQQQQQQQQGGVEGFNTHLQHYPPSPPQPVNTIPLTTAAGNPTNISPNEKPKLGRVFSSDDDKSDHGGVRRSSPPQPQQQQQQPQQLQQQQQQQQQQKPTLHDLPITGDGVSRPMYYQEKPPPLSDPNHEAPVPDASFRLPVQVTDKGYLLQPPPPPPPPMHSIDLLQPPPQHHTPPQYVQANPQLLHHHVSGTVLPINPYYQMPLQPQQHLPQGAYPYNPQIPMYSLPLRQGPAYNLQVQPTLGDAAAAAPVPSSSKPSIPPPNAVFHPGAAPPRPELPGNIYRAAISAAAPAVAQSLQPTPLTHLADPSQYVGYHSMQQPRPQSAAAMPAAGYGYEYTDAAHPQQVYYTQATSAALGPQYQAMSSGAAMAEFPPPALRQPTDAKQTNAP